MAPRLPQAQRLPFTDRVQLKQTTFYVTGRAYRIDRVRGTLSLCFNPRQQVERPDWRREEIAQA